MWNEMETGVLQVFIRRIQSIRAITLRVCDTSVRHAKFSLGFRQTRQRTWTPVFWDEVGGSACYVILYVIPATRCWTQVQLMPAMLPQERLARVSC